ncbi:MAG: FAD-dependent oxidoreductase [Nocardioides sp.]
MARVTVVGAGVVGLSCAVRLLEGGHRVDVLARELPLETTSHVAAAIWYPYLAEPRERVLGWGGRTFEVLADLAATTPEAGVRLLPGTEVLTGASPDPWWAGVVTGFGREPLLPAGYADGWGFTTPVADMPVYLTWLRRRVADLGGTVTRLTLSELPVGSDVVVNCSGLGARHLAADGSVVPVRGQVVVVEQFGLSRWWLDEGGPTYVIPANTRSSSVAPSSAAPGSRSRTRPRPTR